MWRNLITVITYYILVIIGVVINSPALSERNPVYSQRKVLSININIKYSRLTQQCNSFTRFGAKVWNCFPSQMYKLNKPVFKRKIREALFEVLDIEDNYVEAPILLLKMNRHLK